MLPLNRLKLVTNSAIQTKSTPLNPALSRLASPLKGQQDKFIRTNTVSPQVKFSALPLIPMFAYAFITTAASMAAQAAVKKLLEGSGEKAVAVIPERIQALSSENRTMPTPNITEKLISAIQSNKIYEVKEYIEAGHHLDFLDSNGWAPIHTAAKHGRVKIIKLLADAGADIHVEASEAQKLITPLDRAVEKNKPESVKLLLQLGAGSKIDECKWNGWTPLTSAIYSNNLDIANYLIEAGTDIDYMHTPSIISQANTAINSHPQSLLRQIIAESSFDAFKMVLELGANPFLLEESLFNNYGKRWINLFKETKEKIEQFKTAAKEGNLQSLKALLKEHERLPMGVDGEGNTLLHIAAKERHGNIVDWLVKHDVKLFKKNLEGKTPLDVLNRDEHEDLIPVLKLAEEKAMLIHSFLHADMENLKKFVKDGGDVSQPIDSKGNTLLHLGAQKGYYYAKWLAEEGVSIYQKNDDGKSPLDLAWDEGYRDLVPVLEQGERNAVVNMVRRGNLEKIKELMDNSKQQLIRIFDENENTLVHLAIAERHPKVVKYLIEKSGQIEAKNNKDQNPFDVAEIVENNEIIEILNKALLFQSVENSQVEKLRQLVKGGVDVDQQDDERGWTPLHLSVSKGLKNIASILLEKLQAEPDVQDKKGQAPLHLSVINKHLPITKLLLGNDAEVDVFDHKGQSPLYYARQNKRVPTIIKALEDKKASVEVDEDYIVPSDDEEFSNPTASQSNFNNMPGSWQESSQSGNNASGGSSWTNTFPFNSTAGPSSQAPKPPNSASSSSNVPKS